MTFVCAFFLNLVFFDSIANKPSLVERGMSKNTREANFRKVDVDELDEEQFRDDAEEEEDQSDQIGQREAEVKKLISRYPLII